MGTQSNGDGGHSRELVEAFAKLTPHWIKWLHQSAEPAGITPARLRLLGALYVDGPQIMHQLSDRLAVTPRNITSLVDGLEDEHLVARRPHPTDRRATVISLTAKGRKLTEDWWDEHLDRTSLIFAELPERDQRTLLRILGRLDRAFAERVSV